jgi:AcrR family transcriptional regulator
MARVLKALAVRRAEILDAAQALFLEKGYEATSIHDIIVRAGISKGGFYHHFAAKEDLLAALVEQTAAELVERLRPILSDVGLDALSRLNRIMAVGTEWKAQNAPALRYMAESMLRPENTLLLRRIEAATFEILHPIVCDIIAEGVAQKIFSTTDPALVAEFYLAMSPRRQAVVIDAFATLDRGDLKSAIRLMETRMQAEARVLERLLGLQPASVQLYDPNALRALMKGLIATSRQTGPHG